jgi:hypothetical protein
MMFSFQWLLMSFFSIVYYFNSYEMYIFFCFGDYPKVVWHETMWFDKTLYILLICFYVYCLILYIHARILFHSIDSSKNLWTCNFSSFQHVWKYWRCCIKARCTRSIGCTYNDKMHPYILSFTSKLRMWCGKYSMPWNIF